MFITGVVMLIVGAAEMIQDVSTGICPAGCDPIGCTVYGIQNDENSSGYVNEPCTCIYYAAE